MSTLAVAEVILRATGGSVVTRIIDTLTGRFNVLGGTMSRVTGLLSSSLSRLASPLSLALGGAAGGFGLSSMLSQAANIEQLEVAFATLTGSAEQAKQTIKELQQFGAQTPFEFSELAPAARSLLAFGLHADDLIPTLTAIGDIASGTGNRIGDIAEIFGKAKVQGRLFMEDINQLTGRGIPVIGSLAKQFGVSESAVRKLVEEGKVGFPQLAKAFAAMTSSGGQFQGMMAAQSGTLAGLFSTVKDNVSMTMAEIGTQLVEALDLKSVATSMIKWTETIRSSAGPAIKQFAGDTQRLLSDLGITWDSLNATFSVTRDMLAGFRDAIAGSASALGAMFQALTDGSAAIESTGSALKEMAVSAGSIGASIGFVARNWDIALLMMWERTKLFASNSWERIKTLGLNFVELLAWMSENWSTIFTDMYEFTKTVFQNLSGNLVDLFSKIWEWVKSGFRGELELDWAPLSEGFEAQTKTWPTFTAAAVKESSEELDRLQREFDQRAIEQGFGVPGIGGGAEQPKSVSPGPGGKATGTVGGVSAGLESAAGTKGASTFSFASFGQKINELSASKTDVLIQKSNDLLAENIKVSKDIASNTKGTSNVAVAG